MGGVWIWRYVLEAEGGLNSRTGRTRYEGALVREAGGFACLHPWPELGDPDLDSCLGDLAGRRKLPLVCRALLCLEEDARARQAGRSLFDGLEVPESHATIPVLSRKALEESLAKGFDRFKIKAGRRICQELNEIREYVRDFPDVRWRIDFNEKGMADDLIERFGSWSDNERSAIDFLEDPVRYDSRDWAHLHEQTGLVLANDHQVEADRGDSGVLIVKPAVNDMVKGKRVIVTSYLDHPVGQVFAAWEAARHGITEVCGLQTHGVYAATGFSEMLGPVNPRFRIPEGTGLGFDDLLEQLPWVRL